MASLPLNPIVDDIVEINRQFAEIAMGEGFSILLLLVGSILVAATLGVFGYLTVGALLSLFNPGSA